jgi:crotonobetainyl-CoA:carnitine CoA-transferase CaiB-like acyl-CoA transferase
MLGMTNGQHYWPSFCQAFKLPDLEKDPKFATAEARAKNSEELVAIIEKIFRGKTYEELTQFLGTTDLIWAPVMTALEVTQDEQASVNGFFKEFDHPRHGPFRLVQNPIKLSETPAEINTGAPNLGEHTDQIMKDLGFLEQDIARLRQAGIIG